MTNDKQTTVEEMRQRRRPRVVEDTESNSQPASGVATTTRSRTLGSPRAFGSKRDILDITLGAAAPPDIPLFTNLYPPTF